MPDPRAGQPAPSIPLRDGSSALVRPIRASDKALIRAGFERLSEQSRYRRFLAPLQELSESALRYLTEVDHRDHEALIAVDPESHQAVGVARYIRTTDPHAAEGRGDRGRRLAGQGSRHRAARAGGGARERGGVSRFIGVMLAANVDMLDLMRRLGPARVVRRAGATVEVEAELPEAAPASGLEPALRPVRGRALPCPGGGDAGSRRGWRRESVIRHGARGLGTPPNKASGKAHFSALLPPLTTPAAGSVRAAQPRRTIVTLHKAWWEILLETLPTRSAPRR